MKHFLPFMLCVSLISAQSFQFERVNIEEGLSQGSVFCITQDRNGFLWFGTLDGLNRFDGYSFKTFKHDPNDLNSVAANNFYKMYSLSDGSIIASTQNNSINILRDHGRSITRLDARTPGVIHQTSNSLRSCFEDSNGTLYFGTNNTLVEYSLTTGKRTDYPVLKINDLSAVVSDIIDGPDGNLWCALQTTPQRFDRQTKQFSGVPLAKEVVRIVQDKKILSFAYSHGTLLAAYDGIGLMFFDDKRGVMDGVKMERTVSFNISSKFIRTIITDRSGNVWMGTDKGLYRLEIDHTSGVPVIRSSELFVTDESNVHSISHNNILSLYLDRENILWVGTTDGLNKLPLLPKKFTTISHDPHNVKSIGPGIVWMFVEDSNQSLYVGTQQDLNTRKPGDEEFSRSREIAPVCGVDGGDGSVWMGTREGFFQVKEGMVIRKVVDTMSNRFRARNFIYSMTMGADGILWCATGVGLVRYDPKLNTFDRFLSDDSITVQSNFLLSVLQRRNGEIWVGTNGFGIARFTPETKKFRLYRSVVGNPRSLGNDVIFGLTESRDGTVWIATNGGGLNKMIERGNDSVEFVHYREADGFPNDAVYGIVEGNNGLLWASTNKGIVKFDPDDGSSKLFTVADGLQRNEFSQNAYYKNSRGKLFFGGGLGFNEFYPDSILENSVIPHIQLTEFKVFEKERTAALADSVIHLPYNENFFSFEFASLSFLHPENNRYAFRLEGLQDSWVDIGHRRSAYFTNIDPGDYVFRVKGTNNDGVWNEQGASVRIIISPPWWATAWFRLFAGITFAGCLSGGAWYISRRKFKATIAELEQQKKILEERQRTRDKIARDLHDDLASTVGSAGLYVESAKRKLTENSEQAREYLEKTSSILNEAEEAMSDIVWSVSPKHDSLHSLATRIRLVATDLCRANSIGCSIDIDGSTEIPLSEDIRRGVYLVFKEILNNSLKHSKAAHINIRIGIEGSLLILVVKDDGIGFVIGSPAESLGGNGMQNIRKRAEEIGATISIQSEINKGTEIIVKRQMTHLSH